MNAAPQARRYFPTLLDADQAHAEAGHCRHAIVRRGWGMWPLEPPGHLEFAGFVGLNAPHFDAPARTGSRDRLAPAARSLGPRSCH